MPTDLTLYAIEEGLRALLDTEELTEGDERLAILDEIAQKTEQAIAKRDNLIRFLLHLDHQKTAIDVEIERLSRLKESYQCGRERVEKYVVSIMERFVEQPKRGVKKLEGSIGVLALRKNPDRVNIIDEDLLPDTYYTVNIQMTGEQWVLVSEYLLDMFDDLKKTVTPDKRAIRRAMESGAEVIGADIIYGDNRLEVR